MNRPKGLLSALCAMLLVGGMAYGAPAQLAAQEGTPQVENQVGGQFVAIYEGTCDSLAEEAAFEIGEAFLPGTADDDEEEASGTRDAVAVLTVESNIESSFGELFDDAEHAMVVLASAGQIDSIVACGGIGGVIDNGRLAAGLTAVENSGIQGIVVFDEDEEGFLGLGENEVNVRVYLLAEQAMSAEEEAGGMASPATESMEEASPTPES